ncbi:SURF1 family protein [Corynebacterium sp.]|uniref:SURF1 family cytochrome oxidase biogenesis protein n=1 Tax=Corynebacterium sp. TaxID=1720 RepID=UPI0026E09773|nr:SURF1 family protein [Corynebacterium sp.]MDO5511401.1 SURF1 family protein [Corynebacterium sp.]
MDTTDAPRQRYGSRHSTGKKGLLTFLKPGWIIMVLLIIAFSYVAFTFLAPWQLGKDDAIVHRNNQIDAAFRADPVPVTEVFGSGGELAADDEWRRVTLQGEYLPGDEVLLRMRPVDSSPAFHALTPFRLTTGETFLVNRGFTVPIDGNIPDMTDAPTGEITIQGHARLNEFAPTTAPMEDQGYRQVYGIHTQQVSEVVGVPLARDYVQLSDGQPGELNAIPVPKLDRGSHLSYGFQWIAFGIMAPLGLGYFIWAELRERRRVREESQELGDTPAAEAGDTDDTADTAPATETQDTPRRARYGDAHPDHYERFAKRERERF